MANSRELKLPESIKIITDVSLAIPFGAENDRAQIAQVLRDLAYPWMMSKFSHPTHEIPGHLYGIDSWSYMRPERDDKSTRNLRVWSMSQDSIEVTENTQYSDFDNSMWQIIIGCVSPREITTEVVKITGATEPDMAQLQMQISALAKALYSLKAQPIYPKRKDYARSST